jgi:hypothetical protein
MILLLLSIILLALKLCGVITWSYWIVSAPALVLAVFSSFIYIKTEIQYLRVYNKNNVE